MDKRARTYLYSAALTLCTVVLVFILYRCSDHRIYASGDRAAVEVMQDWYRHMLNAERHVEGFRGPVIARVYGYMGIAAYETARWKTSRVQTYKDGPPQWLKPGLPDTICLAAALDACYESLSRFFIVNAPYTITEDRERTAEECRNYYSQNTDEKLIQRSQEWGRAIATAVFAWASTDSLGHMSQFQNYDRNYTNLPESGKWKPSDDIPMPALLPYWGGVRMFSISIEDFPTNSAITYSTSEGSPYYTQIYEVYSLSAPLSAENRWIAEFWSDDHPGLTFTPTGRWISITSQAIEKSRPSVSTALETYLKVGIALSDATVLCWQAKYSYNTERPETFIRTFIDKQWQPLHHAPPFPGYPSGHATMSAAAAEVLSEMFGARYHLTDRSHKDRTEFKGVPRSYTSFHEMAQESAFSRLVLGVHIRADCEEGLRIGKLVGARVAEIRVADMLAYSR